MIRTLERFGSSFAVRYKTSTLMTANVHKSVDNAIAISIHQNRNLADVDCDVAARFSQLTGMSGNDRVPTKNRIQIRSQNGRIRIVADVNRPFVTILSLLLINEPQYASNGGDSEVRIHFSLPYCRRRVVSQVKSHSARRTSDWSRIQPSARCAGRLWLGHKQMSTERNQPRQCRHANTLASYYKPTGDAIDGKDSRQRPG